MFSFLIFNRANLFEKRARNLLTPQNGFNFRGDEPILRSGLYVVRSFVSTAEERAYILYWPEDTTWNDQAVSTVQRNRVTFMRYDNSLRVRPRLTGSRTCVGTSRSFAIRSFAFSHRNIHKPLCGVTRMMMMFLLIRITTTRAGFTIS
jgi:hypothetical protein